MYVTKLLSLCRDLEEQQQSLSIAREQRAETKVQVKLLNQQQEDIALLDIGGEALHVTRQMLLGGEEIEELS